MSEVKGKAEDKQVIEEEVTLDGEAQDQIVTAVKDAVMPELREAVGEVAKEAIEEANKSVLDQYLEKTEEIERKAVEAAQAGEVADDPVAKGVEEGKLNEKFVNMSPAMRLFKQMRALVSEDGATLRALNKVSLATQLKARGEVEKEGAAAVAKTGYANEGTAGDGSVLVPDADFITTVFDNLPKYGVAFQDADVRQTDRTSVRVISLDSGLTFYATAEAGVKTAAKLQFSKNEVSLQKYAVIVPATDELTEDAAVDFWNLVTRELSRGYAKKADEITFTDTSSGITNQTGVLTYAVSGAGSTITWDDLLNAQAKTEDDLDESGAKWYMRKETWYRLVQLKAAVTGEYLSGSANTATGWVANPNQPTTPWGTPVQFTRVLPTSTSVNANDGYAVYGDLSNYLLFNKRGMQLKMLTEATILDADSVSTNLATQDISAMRAVVRMLGILPKGNRGKFVVLGTGTVS